VKAFGLVAAVVAVAFGASLASGAPVPSQVVVTCDLASMGMGEARPSDGDRVVLGGRLAVPPKFVPHLNDEKFPMRYFAKWGILVRPGKGAVEIVVPPAWRNRVAIEWGEPSRAASSLRVGGCSAPGRQWIPYGGGFHVAAASCVPLIVRSAGRTQSVRFGVGRRC
jgi:hypothetical protein